MKRLFISSGELSGDRIAAWYLAGYEKESYCEGIGGDFLKQQGIVLYERMEKLSFVGVTEILKNLRYIFRFLDTVTRYILNNKFEEVLLVDFPGFNLMLAKKLKQAKPNLKIVYLSPPQLWVWGAWRINKIKRYIDKLVVIYPFEVDWYKKRGVDALWLGYPFYNDYAYITAEKQKKIAILPGSRRSETESLLPFFIEVIHFLRQRHPELKFVIPLAESFTKDFIEEKLKEYGLYDIEIVAGDKKNMALAECILAISKPGTATLQLALMRIPTIIIYKTSWITYFVARIVANVKYMGLANLLLNREIVPEFIQGNCNSKNIYEEASRLYTQFLFENYAYLERVEDFNELHSMLNRS